VAVRLGANETEARLISAYFNTALNEVQNDCGDIIDEIRDLEPPSPGCVSINWNLLLKNVKHIRAQAKLYQTYINREGHRFDSKNSKTIFSLQKRVAIIQEILPD